MIITMENINSTTIRINDLGCELVQGDIIDLLENYTRDDILKSEDLETIYDNGYIEFQINNSSSSLIQVIKAITGMTEIEHENLDTLIHSLSETAYFNVERNLDDIVEKIIYYTDSSKTLKIREEEILRINDEVSQIIKRQFDVNGVIIKTETQTINRTVDGSLESIGTTTI